VKSAARRGVLRCGVVCCGAVRVRCVCGAVQCVCGDARCTWGGVAIENGMREDLTWTDAAAKSLNVLTPVALPVAARQTLQL
jgi:hypothetical protein